MNRKELVGAVATHTGMEPREVDKALKGMTEVIEAVAAKGEQVTISGFAKFARVDRPARMARNPATGAPVKVKASKKAKITPLKGFKDAVMSASAAPKLAKGRVATSSQGAGEGGAGQKSLGSFSLHDLGHQGSCRHVTDQAADGECCPGAKEGCCSKDGRQEAVGRGRRCAPQPALWAPHGPAA